MIVGARVSTGSQSVVAQDAALHAAGCARMFHAKLTVTSNQLWAWIKRRQPAWQELGLQSTTVRIGEARSRSR